MVKSTQAAALTAVAGGPETPSNDGAEIIQYAEPALVRVTLEGSSALLFHRWSVESVAEKSAAAKNSRAKKTDDVESYVWRNDDGAEYVQPRDLLETLTLAGRVIGIGDFRPTYGRFNIVRFE